MAGSKQNSRALKFYSDVLGLEHLHYGIWEASDELTLANLKAAQDRYQQAILDLLPAGSEDRKIRVLDVGCGTGELSKALKARGYEVEGLSPDINHVDSYAEKVGQPFYQCVFEDFSPDKLYDVVIMLESCQYIALDKLFPVLDQCLTKDGVWVVVDYFVLDGVSGTMAKSGHTYTEFQRAVSDSWQPRLVPLHDEPCALVEDHVAPEHAQHRRHDRCRQRKVGSRLAAHDIRHRIERHCAWA